MLRRMVVSGYGLAGGEGSRSVAGVEGGGFGVYWLLETVNFLFMSLQHRWILVWSGLI